MRSLFFHPDHLQREITIKHVLTPILNTVFIGEMTSTLNLHEGSRFATRLNTMPVVVIKSIYLHDHDDDDDDDK